METADLREIGDRLATRADPNDLSPFRRKAAVHIAAKRGDVHVMNLLLASGGEPNISRGGWGTKAGNTPLHEAARTGQKEMVDALLANPKTSDVPNKNGQHARDLAPPSAAGDSIRNAIDQWSRGHQERFDSTLAAATTTTLIPSMRDVLIPDQLSTAQIETIKSLCAHFHPEVLTSPLIDVNGHPVTVEVPTVRLTDPGFFGKNVEKPENIKRTVEAIFTDYPAHLKWLRENTAIRKITAEDVSSRSRKLVGQEGWFATKRIPRGTPIALLNGMILEDPHDIEIDKKLRKLAGCDNYFIRKASKGKILQAMGHSMKCNAISGLAEIPRLNLKTLIVDVTRSENQERFKILIYFAQKDIKANEQLLALYSPKQGR